MENLNFVNNLHVVIYDVATFEGWSKRKALQGDFLGG